MAQVLDEDEPIEHWTLIGDELDLLAGRTGPSTPALALWLKFFTVEGQFPAGRAELPDEAVGHVWRAGRCDDVACLRRGRVRPGT